ncbi:MAG: zf-TFIIB domain-containing protein [Methylococcales bacterium]|nr:zf-TFIIB domain-containing protein [Methylococcales bacterium]MCK5926013.1 zf-TFIIB domain-containing protein [Methylococcales bacterium]
MAYCKSCSAPLRSNINRCEYCDTHNDIDLAQKHDFSLDTTNANTPCPHCKIVLDTITLKIKQNITFKRCHQCFGLFLHSHQLDEILENSVPAVEGINMKKIQEINKDRYQVKKVKYIKCPVCTNLMARSSFAYRSGVVIDKCLKHGMWLDNGEMTHLMEWKKAGGQLLAERKNKKSKKKPKRKIINTELDKYSSIDFSIF